jgi:putative ABC transport system permease protein
MMNSFTSFPKYQSINGDNQHTHARFLYQDASMSQGATISVWRLFLALLCPISIVFLSWHLNLQISRKIVLSVSRTIIQLLLAGYVLLSFIFSMNSPVIILIYICMMMLIAALEATSRQIRTYPGHFYDSLCAVFLGGGCVGAFGAVVVFNPSPWWEPHVFVPTAGMIIGNSISGPSVAVDRLLADVADKRHESETRLAFGATRYEAILPTMRSAILAALMPNLNMMNVVGLVSIPGMMTGQLLGGAIYIKTYIYTYIYV